MALLDLTQAFVGTDRRADANLRQSSWYPKAYVRVQYTDSADNTRVFNVSPDNARQLAKALKFNADLIDPPKPRKRG